MKIKMPKFKFKLRRMDVERILITCSAAFVVLLAVRGGGPTEMYEEPYDQIPAEQTATTAETPTQSTVVYYQDGDGYLVPVQREVEQQEGIAKATLSLMVANAKNDMEAARLGLLTVVPEGTTFDLDISGGHARVDLSAEALNNQTAEQESNMVSAVVWALTEFPTVSDVEFLVDGQQLKTLPHGTPIEGRMQREGLNLERVETVETFAGANQVQLYFPSDSGRLLVPVTRTVYSDEDVATAMLEWLKGPRDDSGLQEAAPSDAALLGVTIKDGVATVNFTEEFVKISEQSDGGVQSMRALVMTCRQFPGVQRVQVQVEGEPYELPTGQKDQPTFANVAAEVVEQFPEVMQVE